MKKLFVFCLMLAFIAACGGGGGEVPEDDATTPDVSEPAEEVPDDPLAGLPAIQDNYVDDEFIYEDMSIYVGVYQLPDDSIYDECNMGGLEPPIQEVEVVSVSTSSLNTLTNGVSESFPYNDIDLYDMYSFTFSVDTVDCTFALVSDNFDGQTTDRLGIYCHDNGSDTDCYTEWQRSSSYDYTSYNVKSLDVDSSNNRKEMVREIHESK